MYVIHKAWRWYFWAAAIVIALSVFRFSLKEGLADWWSFGHLMYNVMFSIVLLASLLCLYGFAWQVRLGRQEYWIALFYINAAFILAQVVYTVVTIISFPTSEIQALLSEHPGLIESMRIQIIGMTLLINALILPMLIANYRYAFHNKHLWTTTT